MKPELGEVIPRHAMHKHKNFARIQHSNKEDVMAHAVRVSMMRDPENRPEQPIVENQQPSSKREVTAELAYYLWEERGKPEGSPEVDWFAAEKALAASHPAKTDQPAMGPEAAGR
jgi:hypothetical protein